MILREHNFIADRQEMPEWFWDGARWLTENNFVCHTRLYDNTELVQKPPAFERFLQSMDGTFVKVNVTFNRESEEWEYTVFRAGDPESLKEKAYFKWFDELLDYLEGDLRKLKVI